MLDVRGGCVSNNEIQSVCPETPASEFGMHESLLSNGPVMAMALDALKNGGLADTARLDMATVCQQLAHPAMNVTDVSVTEGLIPLAAINVLEFEPSITRGPTIREYAR
jgi:hypothetical protein